ncbi:MAG: hypothetical protein F6K17_24225 [Okeania sp. SIO3C4]|nr:hypothetical protein [Okeania sp. SIO3C4]
METKQQIEAIETILEPWKETIGNDFIAYKNHVYRMTHFCLALGGGSDTVLHKVAIAACHHDIGIWTDNTVDYLPPSAEKAREYLVENDREAWTEEILAMINDHHKVRAVRDAPSPLVETFRRADLVDVSLGLIRFGLPKAYINVVKSLFPNAGFHRRLNELSLAWFLRHPLNPVPFMKW